MKVSLPAPPVMVSRPPPVVMVSAPAPPLMVSAPELPVIASSPAPPVIVAATAAVTVTLPPAPVAVTPDASSEVMADSVESVKLKPASPATVMVLVSASCSRPVKAVVAAVVSVSSVVIATVSTLARVTVPTFAKPSVALNFRLKVSAVPAVKPAPDRVTFWSVPSAAVWANVPPVVKPEMACTRAPPVEAVAPAEMT